MQTLQQLHALWHKGEYVELRAITPDQKVTRAFFRTPEEAATWAEKIQGGNVYVGANPRAVERGDKAAVQTMTALFVDLDVANDEQKAVALDALTACELVPNMIVSSGRGLHAYWLIEPTTDKATWREVNTRLYEHFANYGADKTVATDEARILRLAPFPNLKYGEPLPTKLLHIGDTRFTLDEVRCAFGVPAVAALPAAELVPMPSDAKNLVIDANRLLRHAIEQAKIDGRNNAGFALACQVRDNGIPEPETVIRQYVEAVQGIGDHPYTLEEAMASLRSAYKGEKREPWSLQVTQLQVIQERADILEYAQRLHRTDTGNAELFAYHYENVLRYNRATKRWYVWNGVRWQVDTHNGVAELALQTIRLRQQAFHKADDDEQRGNKYNWAVQQENFVKREAMLNIAKEMRPFLTTADDWDQDPYAAAVLNGVLDLHQGTLVPAKPEAYLSKALGTRYDPAAMCPRWTQFIDEVFNHDEELIAYVQRAIGYSLTGDTREHALFLCYGGGKNGKSVFLSTLSKLYGDFGATTSFATFEAGNRDQTNDLARLKGIRFVAISEANEDRMINEARVKSVTGGDRISCRFLYGEFFEYTPQFKIWLAMNHKPIVRGGDDGIWRRMHLIPFTQKFDGEREDKTLTAKLEAELPGILNWAREGLAQWRKHGLGMPAAVRQAVSDYRTESDVVGTWLEEAVIITGNEANSTPMMQLYESYAQWARGNGLTPMSSTSFGRRMADRGLKTGSVRQNKGGIVRAVKGVVLANARPVFCEIGVMTEEK